MYKIPKEVLDYFRKFEWFDKSKLIIDQSDGLWIYDGYIDFSDNEDFVEFPEWFRNFKEIRGHLRCGWTNLQSFKGLENLKKIGGGLFCFNTSITSFEGLENLLYIAGTFNCSASPHIQSFKGLENLKKIGGMLDCSGPNNLNTFDGLNPFINIKGWDGYKIFPSSRNPEFLQWQKQARKSKQIKDIINFMDNL